MTATLAN